MHAHPATRPPGRPLSALLLPAVLIVACAAQPNPSPSMAVSGGTPGASETAGATESAAATAVLEPGGLQAGTRYTLGDLGLSLQPDADGWFAVLPSGGDMAISRDDVTVYVYLPETILDADGNQVPVPDDPQAVLDAADATDIVDVASSEPFEPGGAIGLSAELEAAGGSEGAPLLTTGSGSLGLPDGRTQWIVLEAGGRPVIFSLERASAPDVAATWEVAGQLVESLQATP
jgi:hypothetical protein